MCKHFFAVDLGATSSRTILATFDGSRVEMKEVTRFANPMIPLGGHLYWDIAGLYNEVLRGVELAEATIKAIDDDYDVVMWEKHGVFAVDTDIMSAFDQVDVLNKAALIYIASKNMGFEPEGMSDAQMKELSDTFGLPK